MKCSRRLKEKGSGTQARYGIRELYSLEKRAGTGGSMFLMVNSSHEKTKPTMTTRGGHEYSIWESVFVQQLTYFFLFKMANI